MRPVSRPRFGVQDTYALCIGGVRNKHFRARLKSITSEVVNAAESYAERAAAMELHLIPQEEDVAGIVTKDEMVGVYDKRMARKGSRGRSVYDGLKGLPDYGICPFCDHCPVSTLDHILPKALYPALVVTPDNLVGSCRECNSSKSANAPTNGGNVPLHPYFDDVSSDRWLEAIVVVGEVPSVMFFVKFVPQWTDEMNARVRQQFETLQLGRLYSSQCAREISGRRITLCRVYRAAGWKGVRRELKQRAIEWGGHNINGWQAVMFRALSKSKWYCKKGFRKT